MTESWKGEYILYHLVLDINKNENDCQLSVARKFYRGFKLW